MPKKPNFLVIYIAMSPTTNGQVWLSLMTVKAVDLAAVAADAGKIHVRDAEGQSSPADWPLGPRQLRHRVRGHSRRRTVYLSCHQLTGNRRGICRRPYARYASLFFNLTHYCIINCNIIRPVNPGNTYYLFNHRYLISTILGRIRVWACNTFSILHYNDVDAKRILSSLSSSL